MTPSHLFARLRRTSAPILALAALFLLARPSRAQWGAAATFSASRLNLQSYGTPVNDVWVYGPTLSVQHESGRILRFGFDARAAFLRSGDYGVNAGDVGPRVAVRIPYLHLKPYGEFLIGYMGARSTSSGKYTTHVDAQLIGGLDVPLRSHIDLRLEYSSAGIFYLSGVNLGGTGEDGRRQISAGLLAHF